MSRVRGCRRSLLYAPDEPTSPERIRSRSLAYPLFLPASCLLSFFLFSSSPSFYLRSSPFISLFFSCHPHPSHLSSFHFSFPFFTAGALLPVANVFSSSIVPVCWRPSRAARCRILRRSPSQARRPSLLSPLLPFFLLFFFFFFLPSFFLLFSFLPSSSSFCGRRCRAACRLFVRLLLPLFLFLSLLVGVLSHPCQTESGRAVGGMGDGRVVEPVRYVSTAAAAERPSAIAQTISDCPRPASPATKTPGSDVM